MKLYLSLAMAGSLVPSGTSQSKYCIVQILRPAHGPFRQALLLLSRFSGNNTIIVDLLLLMFLLHSFIHLFIHLFIRPSEQPSDPESNSTTPPRQTTSGIPCGPLEAPGFMSSLPMAPSNTGTFPRKTSARKPPTTTDPTATESVASTTLCPMERSTSGRRPSATRP